MGLFRLAYLSSSAMEVSPEDYQLELSEILLSSRRNNAENGITGALLTNRQYFSQVLEGERPAVDAVYHRVAEDDRHKNLVIISAGDVVKRLFQEWSMAHLDFSHRADDDTVRQMVRTMPADTRVEAEFLLNSMCRMLTADAAA